MLLKDMIIMKMETSKKYVMALDLGSSRQVVQAHRARVLRSP